MLKPVRTAAPSETPVSLSEVKAHLRVDHSDEDTLIGIYIDAAVSLLDGYSGTLGRALVTQTWRCDFDAFADKIRLPLGDLGSVTSVQYYDGANALQTLSTDYYTALSDALGPYVTLKPDQNWPQTYVRDDAIRVTWTAGFGAAAAVPPAIRAAMLLLIGHWYENREAVAVGETVTEMPMSARALLEPYRLNQI